MYFAGVRAIMLKIKTGLAPVVEKLDLVLSTGEKKNHYPVYKYQGKQLHYRVKRDLSGGYHYPPFEKF